MSRRLGLSPLHAAPYGTEPPFIRTCTNCGHVQEDKNLDQIMKRHDFNAFDNYTNRSCEKCGEDLTLGEEKNEMPRLR